MELINSSPTGDPKPARPTVCKSLFFTTEASSSFFNSSATSRTSSPPPPPSSPPHPDEDNDDVGTTPTSEFLISSTYYRYMRYRDFVDYVSRVTRDMSPDSLMLLLRFASDMHLLLDGNGD
jgi:hypothetical protein